MRRRERLLLGALLTAYCGVAHAATAQDVIHVTMIGQHLAIPAQYFLDGIHPREGSEADGLLLGANWPAMTGNSDEDAQGLRILIQPITGNTSGATMLARRLETLTRLGQTSVERQPGDEASPRGNGIAAVSKLRPLDMYMWKEVYVVDPASPTDIVACASIKDVPVPSCIQNFAAGQFYFQVTYPRKLVTDWSDIKKQTNRLFAQFEGQ